MDPPELGSSTGKQGGDDAPGGLNLARPGSGSAGPTAAEDGRAERILRVFIDESMLWPVLIVLVAHAVALFAPVLLFGLRDRNVFGMAGIAILFGLSLSGLHRDWRQRRLRRLTAIGLCVWLLGGLVAWLGDHYGAL